jgi:hypothetical protein
MLDSLSPWCGIRPPGDAPLPASAPHGAASRTGQQRVHEMDAVPDLRR